MNDEFLRTRFWTAAALTGTLLCGCSPSAHAKSAPTAAATAFSFVVPTPPGDRPHFRIIDIGKPGVPTLEPLQAGWVLTIVTNDYWARHIDGLWFIPERSTSEPLIVFYVRDVPYSGLANQVIGENCGVYAVISKGLDVIQGPAGGGGTLQCKRDPLSQDHASNFPLPRSAPEPDKVRARLLVSLRGMAKGEHWP